MAGKKDKLSVFLSLVLRHKPEAANISLDNYGWADVELLIKGVNATGRNLSLDVLEEMMINLKSGRTKDTVLMWIWNLLRKFHQMNYIMARLKKVLMVL